MKVTILIQLFDVLQEMKFKPLAGFSLINAREEANRVRRMWLMGRQAIAYLCYLWLLMVLCYVHFSGYQYHMSNRLHGEYISTPITDTTYSFENLER